MGLGNTNVESQTLEEVNYTGEAWSLSSSSGLELCVEWFVCIYIYNTYSVYCIVFDVSMTYNDNTVWRMVIKNYFVLCNIQYETLLRHVHYAGAIHWPQANLPEMASVETFENIFRAAEPKNSQLF